MTTNRLLRSARYVILLSLFSTVLTIMAGCLDVPLGDADSAKIDPALVGVWEMPGDDANKASLVSITAFDQHEYLVTWYDYHKTDSGPQRDGQSYGKAWVTNVGGASFATFQILDPTDPLKAEADKKPAYSVIRWSVSDQGLKLQFVSDDFAKGTKTPAELEKLIADNVDNKAMYSTARDCRKITDPAEADSILKLFH